MQPILRLLVLAFYVAILFLWLNGLYHAAPPSW